LLNSFDQIDDIKNLIFT